jgi:hypothetical protein
LERTTDPFANTISTALVQIDEAGPLATIIDAVNATPSGTAKDLVALERREAAAESALAILRVGKPDAYELALSQLDEGTQRSWQEEVAPELEDLDQDEDDDPNQDEEPYTADAAGLADYLEVLVLPRCATQRANIENRPLIRAQALGEALDSERLEHLSRYEVHLDRKLERMLAILVRRRRCGAQQSQTDPFRKKCCLAAPAPRPALRRPRRRSVPLS